MFTFWSRLFANHLQEEIQWYRQQLLLERQRAEAAIDELLRVRVNVQPVSQRTFEVDPIAKTADRLFRDSEFAGIGETETS